MCDELEKHARRKKEGRLIIISAPSGTGKTTIVNRLLRRTKRLKRSVSYTTRKPRDGEVDKKDYFFTTRRDFLSKKSRGFFLEWASVFDKFYGTSEARCVEGMQKGFDVVLTIDVQGMRKIKHRMKNKVRLITIFVMPPSLSVLKERLMHRKTDSAAEIKKRLRIAKKEMKARAEYDYVVVNRNVESSVKQIKKILN